MHLIMEGITLLVSIILIVFGVLQIILFFKLWGMTNDVRSLKNHLISQLGAKPHTQASTSPSEPVPGVIKNNGISYTVTGKDVEYSDGTKGSLKTYPGYPECGVITDDGFELLYNDVYYASEALYQYITKKTESPNGLYEKRQAS